MPLAPQSLEPGRVIAWHVHRTGYAAFVLSGSYVEAGDGGRRIARPGDVVIHSPFSGHRDPIGRSGARVVNLPLSVSAAMALRSGRVDDPEALLGAVARSPEAIETLLSEALQPADPEQDLPDRLAAALDSLNPFRLSDWAEDHGVSARTVTRHFTRLYGITPSHYRWRSRTLAAWRGLVGSGRKLTQLAHELSFADQAHMSRSVRILTGASPREWRRRSRLSV